MPTPELSIVIPSRDEEDTTQPLLEEWQTITTSAGILWEVGVIRWMMGRLRPLDAEEISRRGGSP